MRAMLARAAAVLVIAAGVGPACADPNAGKPGGPDPACTVGSGKCLTVITTDIDGDGADDTISLNYDRRERIYSVEVRTHNGRFYAPMAGSFDPAADTVSLTLREGAGDLRCRNWTPGKECGRGRSDLFPGKMLYLSHSRQGDFALFMTYSNSHRTREPGGAPRTDGFFLVFPALDGPATPPL